MPTTFTCVACCNESNMPRRMREGLVCASCAEFLGRHEAAFDGEAGAERQPFLVEAVGLMARRYEDPSEICCGQCGRWHSAPACDAWRWQPAHFYRLADGSLCVKRSPRTYWRTAERRLKAEIESLRPISWEDIEF